MSIVGGRNGYDEKRPQGSCYANPFDDWAEEIPSEKKYSACNRITGFLGSMKDSVVSTSGALVSTASSAIIAGLFKGGKYLYSRFSHKQPPVDPTVVIEEEGASDADVNEAEDDKKVQRGPSKVTFSKNLTQGSNGYATAADIVSLSTLQKPKVSTLLTEKPIVGDDEKRQGPSQKTQTLMKARDVFNPFKKIILDQEIIQGIDFAGASVGRYYPMMEAVGKDELGASFCILQAALNSNGILDSLPAALRLRLDEKFLFGQSAELTEIFRGLPEGSGRSLFVKSINILRGDKFEIADIDNLIKGLNWCVSKKGAKKGLPVFEQRERLRMTRTIVLLQFLGIVLNFRREGSVIKDGKGKKITSLEVEKFNESLLRNIAESLRTKNPQASDKELLAEADQKSVHSKMKNFLTCFYSKKDEFKATLSENFPKLYKADEDEEFQEARAMDPTLIVASKIQTIDNVSRVLLGKQEGFVMRYPRSDKYEQGDYADMDVERIVLVEPRTWSQHFERDGVKAVKAIKTVAKYGMPLSDFGL